MLDTSKLGLAKLKLGSVIEPDRIVEASEVPRTSREYTMVMLAVRGAVEAHFRDRGQVVTVVSDGDSIRVLDDAEAADYNAAAYEQGVRKARRAYFRKRAVNLTGLSEGRRTAHLREADAMAFQLNILRRARRKCPLTPRATSSAELVEAVP